MNLFQFPSLLHRAMFIDGIVTVPSGLLLTFAAGWLAQVFSLPEALVFYAGIFLIPLAILMLSLSWNQQFLKSLSAGIIAVNFIWVLGSLWIILGGLFQPNTLGMVFLVVQAGWATILGFVQLVGFLQFNQTNTVRQDSSKAA